VLKTGMIIENRYEILREIGRGGTSCVYLAENIRLHSQWAIKEVYKNTPTDDGSSRTLVAESTILTKLRHPGLPSIIDIIDTPQSILIIMEYVEGISLDKVLEANGACPEEDVLKWGRQLCDVLDYLHTQNPAIIYRDMKPGNVMLMPNGDIKLIDFGMAREFKATSRHDTTNLGTHGYAAPEQYSSTCQTDARTDIYSLGVTLYHLVTGHDPCLPPYGINSIRSINPSLSPGLDRIIQVCTKLRPDERFQSARALRQALDSVYSYVEPLPDEPPKRKSYAWMWSFAAIPLILIITICAVVFSSSNSPTKKFEQEVTIWKTEDLRNYSFTPEVSGYYEVYSESDNLLPVLYLFAEDGTVLDCDNIYGENDEFYKEYWFEVGTTYIIQTTLYVDESYPSTGTYNVHIDYIGQELYD